jgi:hypothetical protein
MLANRVPATLVTENFKKRKLPIPAIATKIDKIYRYMENKNKLYEIRV